jgi:hypothetical protein
MDWWKILEAIFYGIITPLVVIGIVVGMVMAVLWAGGRFFEALVAGGF